MPVFNTNSTGISDEDGDTDNMTAIPVQVWEHIRQRRGWIWNIIVIGVAVQAVLFTKQE